MNTDLYLRHARIRLACPIASITLGFTVCILLYVSAFFNEMTSHGAENRKENMIDGAVIAVVRDSIFMHLTVTVDAPVGHIARRVVIEINVTCRIISGDTVFSAASRTVNKHAKGLFVTNKDILIVSLITEVRRLENDPSG